MAKNTAPKPIENDLKDEQPTPKPIENDLKDEAPKEPQKDVVIEKKQATPQVKSSLEGEDKIQHEEMMAAVLANRRSSF